MADLISRSALAEEIKNLKVTVTGLRSGKGVLAAYANEFRDAVLRIIDEQPTVEAEPVRHGRWEFVPEKDPSIKRMWWDCSECGKTVGEGLSIMMPTDYCPRCGAEMDEEVQDDD